MRRFLCVLVLAAAVGAAQAQTIELEGVKLEPVAQVGNQSLQLNGVGLRKRAVFKVYVAGLYVPQKSKDAAVLLAQKGPRRVSINMLRSVDADTFVGALTDGLKANHSEQQLAALKPQIDAFTAAFKTVGEAKKGDAIMLDFTPETGTRLTVNGQARGTPIAGEEFFTALLRVWLGDKPADSDLKKGMLGG